MPENSPRLPFVVRVADNYAFNDPDAYTHGEFASYGEALAAAKKIVNESLRDFFAPEISADDLYRRYTAFGDDPYILGDTDAPRFSAWEYARRQADRMVAERDGFAVAPGRRRMTPNQIRDLRRSFRLSATEAARLAGIRHAQSWRRYERGTRAMPSASEDLFSLRTVGVETMLRAAQFAAAHHDGQTRKGADRLPYITHPTAVAMKLVNVGLVTDVEVIVAGLLHDTIEDCAVEKRTLAETFSLRVADIVAEVSDDQSLPRGERKRRRLLAAPAMTVEAATVKLADILCNLNDLVLDPPQGWSNDRISESARYYLALAAALPKVNARLLRAIRETALLHAL